ncbi:hypothetical protein [Devosia beringensis]|uniref:hypothetical protein n=1 Tax=Devosia beringensis TaxID=2657486 RepID=UPI00186B8AA6|nr:hypothetical protein [Devosia beringensis]
MNIKAIQSITNPKPLPPGSTGARIRERARRAETTAKLMAEHARELRAAEAGVSPAIQQALDDIAGRSH